jgi:BlaI family transcriptional regulator, penicillinase repressor
VGTENLTDLQLSVMKALWRVGTGTLAEVHAAMAGVGRSLAPTTVATVLQRLSTQGWVKHRKRGRQFEYCALVDEKEAAAGALERMVSAFFGGKVSALAAQLLESENLSEAELAEMRRLIERKGG